MVLGRKNDHGIGSLKFIFKFKSMRGQISLMFGSSDIFNLLGLFILSIKFALIEKEKYGHYS